MGTASDKLFFDVERSFSGKRWLERSSDSRQALALSQQFQLPEIIGRFLNARGIAAEQVDTFLDPKLSSSLPDPGHLLDMAVGVERLVQAIKGKEKIAIFGDYDVDGATSSALLARYFKAIEADHQIYIPDRISEGYGPNIPALEKLKKDGAKVIITVDCGTTAYEPLAFAKEQDLDVIVVDHHVAEAGLPEAVAVINPNRLDEISEHGQLAAVGVSFLLAVALNRGLREVKFFEGNASIKEPNLMNWLDIVALGTVADMVQLTGVNRALVVQGLKVMAKRQNAGLSALADVSRMDEAPSTYHLGFLMGPRVNAGGRVGESYLGAQLLATDSTEKAFNIAQKLDAYNLERREIEDMVLQEALALAETKAEEAGSVVFIAGQGWHPGVIGIVASRLKERYGLPSCVVTVQDGKATGSGRSITGVDLGACVIAPRQAGILTNGGGHAMAAGFSLEEGQLGAFESFLAERIGKQIEEEGIVPTLNVDGSVTLEGATMDLVEVLQKLAPFGNGNAEPRLAFNSIRIAKVDVVGVNHVRCFLSGIDSKKQLAAIAFRCLDTELGQALLNHNGMPLHIVGRLRENIWQGRSSVQLLIDDAAPVG
ncbi:MAG: single-stranded-DNA-specific exonuclease RecJ [Rhodospirillaceae bacterium]|nr:single-stranded-DNA-specific exonuclease RecJ [Rhodospirillaceae bacterium]